MTDREFEAEDAPAQPEEYEVDVAATEGDDLDEAMREALEAVEKSEGDAASQAPDRAETEPSTGLEAKLVELHENNLRTLADFENFRKRVAREQQESRRYEGFGVLAEVLPLLDNLQRAIDAEGQVDDLKVGVEMIARQFQDLLKRHGVERIRAAGEPFDPTLHDAVSRQEDPSVDVATVAEELQPGYLMGERLLRPASVRVSMPAEARRVEITEEEAGE